MKLCKDCRFVRLTELNPGEYSKCTRGVTMNPVTGEMDLPTQSSLYALLLRQRFAVTDCGPEARFFQHARIAIVPEPA